jgi:two-component system response regulator FixJ
MTDHRKQSCIALLDDDPSVRTALGRLLRASGFSVDEHATFASFWKSLERTRPDCLVLDLHMPHMDGIDVMNYLNSVPIRLGIIVVSGHHSPEEEKLCQYLGALDVLSKPIDAEVLLDAIESAVSAVSRSYRASPSSEPLSSCPTARG